MTDRPRPAPRIASLSGEVTPDELEAALEASLIVVSADTVFLPGDSGEPQKEGTPARLVERLGPWAALRFWLRRDPWTARTALKAGLVDAIADEEDARARQDALGAGAATLAAETVERLSRAQPRLDEASGRSLERSHFSVSFADDRARAGARSFLGRRGRRRP